MTGYDAYDALFNKYRDPDLSLYIGSFAVSQITKMSHYDDGKPVITVSGEEEKLLTFEFEPSKQPFASSATDEDGAPMCYECE